MSEEKKYEVPEGMLKAGRSAYRGYVPAEEGARRILMAAIRWLAQNPIVPDDEEINHYLYGGKDKQWVKDMLEIFQRRMFLKPEPEVPEDLRVLLYSPNESPRPDADVRILEAYRLGLKATEKPPI